MVEGARKGDVMGTLFGVAGKDNMGGVVFGGEELEGRGIFERVDVVLFSKLYSVGLFEGVLLGRLSALREGEKEGEGEGGYCEEAAQNNSQDPLEHVESIRWWKFQTVEASFSGSQRVLPHDRRAPAWSAHYGVFWGMSISAISMF